MRITTNMIFGAATRYINVNLQKYYSLEEQLLTQKRINRPSDDPVSATRALDLRKLVEQFNQFDRNMDTAETWASQSETALTNVVDRLQRAIELTVDINDANSGPAEFAAAAEEMNDIFTEVLGSANSKTGNTYIFGGYETTTEPFDAAGAYTGGASGQDIDLEIAQGQSMTINFTGDDVFKGPTDVFAAIQNAATAIASGDSAAISAALTPLEDSLDQVVKYQTTVGARTNRLDLAREDNSELRDSFTSILSNIEDIDVTTVSSEFSNQEQVLEANRLVSARLIQQNFLDFFV